MDIVMEMIGWIRRKCWDITILGVPCLEGDISYTARVSSYLFVTDRGKELLHWIGYSRTILYGLDLLGPGGSGPGRILYLFRG